MACRRRRRAAELLAEPREEQSRLVFVLAGCGATWRAPAARRESREQSAALALALGLALYA